MGDENVHEFQVEGIPDSGSSTGAPPLLEDFFLVLGDGFGHHRYCLRRWPRHGFEVDRLIHNVRVRGVHAGLGSSARL